VGLVAFVAGKVFLEALGMAQEFTPDDLRFNSSAI